MSKKIYALLVGINDYAPEVGKLSGCINDVDRFHDYLTSSFNKDDLAIEVLKDSDATRDNIIKQFRSHLGKAKADDVALFQYSGHGARWAAAKEFKEFYPDGFDEGLVCYDSRRETGTYPFDLADKELAILLSEVAAKNPHLAVILDCCHAGSATRDVDAFNGLKTRSTHEVKDARPLESYINGYYAKKGASLSIPPSQHIALAACERTQKAQENPRQQCGVFTDTLLEVLSKPGSDTYAEIFVRCRAAVRKRAENQNPQFETYNGFNAWAGFLGRQASKTARLHTVEFDDKNKTWKIDAGAIQGFPTDPEKSVGLELYREDDPSRLVGKASTTVVYPAKSDLRLEFESNPDVRYKAEITSLPVPPIPVYWEGDAKSKAVLQKALADDGSIAAIFVDVPEGTKYALVAEDGNFLLKQREMDSLIQGIIVNPEKPEISAQIILQVLKQVVKWEKGWALQNHSTKINPADIDFIFVEKLDDGQEHEYRAEEITLNYVKSGRDWKNILGKIKVRNRTQQELHVILAYFSNAYGINTSKFFKGPIVPSEEYVTIWDSFLYIEGDEVNEEPNNFKLIISTEQVDDFFLEMDDLEIGKILNQRPPGNYKPLKKYENDWFTKNLRIKVVRQLDQVGVRDAKLAQGKIVVKSHPSIKANLSLSAAKTPSRSAGEGTDFYKAFERQGLEMVNFAAGTRGENESILELTDIKNAEALAENPLEIEVNVQLNADEGVLPFVFDGQHVFLGGDTFKDEQGNTHISIDHIPEVPDNRRSLGKALKLYFFKTYLKQDNVNQLRWVEYKDDGAVVRNKTMIAEKVKAAQNIAVLIHGIIGDSEIIAKGLRTAGLDQKFDLVLTYDYENLSTPIAETALDLKKKLEAAGFGANDEKKLTLLAHSMGGLVSRWFIEREGGNAMVDHLVMCGTPNNGSPFGKIDTARKILNVLTGVAMNYVPALIPFNGAVLFLLNRSKKITPTLEQMNPSSEFIATLNSSGDPGIRYTILAGDIEQYQEPSDQLFPKLLAKAAKGFALEALFGMQAHDIAVGVESILGVSGSRNPMPKRGNVPCHHLNYFISAAGQKALQTVEW
jgi:pimeloyl-ACP methyl ester carboxylesterase